MGSPPAGEPRRRGTATSSFGVSRRESHDSSAFYARFAKPELSADDVIAPPRARDQIWLGDAREMDLHGDVADGSVALVVTSPPYFAGKEYEEALGQGHIPASYGDYLGMLHSVFEECKGKLEPGGRIAVNVANLGRKPYRSLSADVIQILEDLGFLLRGEIIWRKQAAAGGSCAWGTYQRPGNPVLRDVTERIVIASKGRFDRARRPERRLVEGAPNEGSLTMDEFMDATTDLWDIPAESARRVGHPAPFPVELPRRLIELYTYRRDLVLDPFMGSGSTAVAAVRTDRSYVGFDTDQTYIDLAEQRIRDERARPDDAGRRVVVPAKRSPKATTPPLTLQQALADGHKATDVARLLLEECGFAAVEENVTYADLGVDVGFRAQDQQGAVWLFELSGGLSVTRPGLKRADNVWRALGKASALLAARRRAPARLDIGPLVLLTVDRPAPASAAERALQQAIGSGDEALVHDIIGLFEAEAQPRLAGLARAQPSTAH